MIHRHLIIDSKFGLQVDTEQEKFEKELVANEAVANQGPRTIDDYLALAKQRIEARLAEEGTPGTVSDRDLSVLLEAGPTAVSNYRTKRAWPSDHAMLLLGLYAGIRPDIALLDLNEWRVKSPEAKVVYQRVRRAMSAYLRRLSTAGVLLLTLVGAAQAQPQPAAGRGAETIHYAIGVRRRRGVAWA